MSKKDNIFGIRKILYTVPRKLNVGRDTTFNVSKNTIEVQYMCNGYPIIRQFLLPFNEIYHMLGSDFVSDVMKKDKNWFVNNIYVFVSFTIKENILLNNLPYKKSKNLDNKDIDDIQYEELFSVTYDLGRANVLEMYKGFIDMIKGYKLKVNKIAYIKIHRLTNSLDNVNLISASKFFKLIERKK